MNSSKVCPTTGKLSYQTAAEAWQVVAHQARRCGGKPYAYRCRDCSHHHVATSKSKRPRAR